MGKEHKPLKQEPEVEPVEVVEPVEPEVEAAKQEPFVPEPEVKPVERGKSYVLPSGAIRTDY